MTTTQPGSTATAPAMPTLHLARVLSSAAEGIRRNPAGIEAILAEASLALEAAQRALATRPDRPGQGLLPWQMRRVQKLVEEGLPSPLPVPAMAAAAQLSRSHFCRAFVASFGVTPHAYVQDRRLARARTMMRETPETLAQIAVACGFADQAHLSRLFRRHAGCTPSAWRRQGRARAA